MKKTLFLFLLLWMITGCTTSDIPKVELTPGKDIIEIGSDHIDQGCFLITDGSKLPMDIVINTVDTSLIGEYEIIYRLFEQGVDHTCKRIVKVIDQGPLRATLKPGIDTITVGERHVDAGIDVDRDNVTITVSNTVDMHTPGTYAITYLIIDSEENETTIRRLVTVLEEN